MNKTITHKPQVERGVSLNSPGYYKYLQHAGATLRENYGNAQR